MNVTKDYKQSLNVTVNNIRNSADKIGLMFNETERDLSPAVDP